MENLFRKEVLANKTHRLDGAVILAQPPQFRNLTILILIFVLLALAFLTTASYARKERVTGVLEPNTGLVKLSAPQTGVITELSVREGTRVHKGDSLLRIQSEKYGVGGFELHRSLINQYQFQIKNLTEQIAYQTTQHQAAMEAIRNDLANLKQRQAQLEVQRKLILERVRIKRDLVSQLAPLAAAGNVSGFEFKAQKDTLLSLEQQSSTLVSEDLSLNGQISQAESRLAQESATHGKTLAQYQKQMREIKEALAKTEQERIGELIAPVDGVVTGVIAKTGKVAQEHQHLLSILPEGSRLQATVYVPTSAAGFIEKGQHVRIRYDAFPYQKFGTYEGTAVEISRNVILPEELDTPGIITRPSYRVIVAIDRDNIEAAGKEFPLRTGMTLEADIVLDHRSFIQWLFAPIYNVRGRL